jgi:hypothetical protein
MMFHAVKRAASRDWRVVGAVALIDVDAAGVAAVALSFLTFGAIAAYVVVLHTNPVLPVAVLAATLLNAWVRRDELLALVRRRVVALHRRDRTWGDDFEGR